MLPRVRVLRSLYVCYLSIADPLVDSQVLAYLDGLAAAGHTIHLLSFEPAGDDRAQRRRVRADLRDRGIHWHRLRYHKRPSLPATLYDVLCGTLTGAWRVRRHRLARPGKAPRVYYPAVEWQCLAREFVPPITTP